MQKPDGTLTTSWIRRINFCDFSSTAVLGLKVLMCIHLASTVEVCADHQFACTTNSWRLVAQRLLSRSKSHEKHSTDCTQEGRNSRPDSSLTVYDRSIDPNPNSQDYAPTTGSLLPHFWHHFARYVWNWDKKTNFRIVLEPHTSNGHPIWVADLLENTHCEGTTVTDFWVRYLFRSFFNSKIFRQI